MKDTAQAPEQPRVAEYLIKTIEEKFSALYPNIDEAEKSLVMLEILEKYANHYLRMKNVQNVHDSKTKSAFSELGSQFFDSLDKIHQNATSYEANDNEGTDSIHGSR